MKRYVIYSAMVGGYDEILQPKVVDDRFDFVLFTNEIMEDAVGVWKIKPIKYYNKDNTRVCRYVKTHPTELLNDYEVSVWMDSNLQIQTSFFYEKVIELDLSGVLISSMKHPTRNCIYEEAFAVMNMRVEYENVVVDWCHKLRNEKYPQNNGMYETGVMFRKHNACLVHKTGDLWWECINNYSRRDQLSFNYVIWKIGVPCTFFFGESKYANNTEHLRLIQHKDEKHNHCPLGKNEAWLMRHCWKDRTKTAEVEQIYYMLYSFPFPHFWIALVGQYFRLLDDFRKNK